MDSGLAVPLALQSPHKDFSSGPALRGLRYTDKD